MTIGAERAQGPAATAVQREWLEPAARAGLAARAVLYGIIGALALAVAVGAGGATTDQQGALATLADETGGKLLIGLLAVGLLGYAVWRLVQAIFDTGGEGDDAKGVVQRIGYGVTAAIHLGLFAFAVKLLAGSGSSSASASGSSGSSSQEQETTAGVLGWPGGRAIIIGVGVYNAYQGAARKFMDELLVSGRARAVVEPLGVVGYVARGAVFVLIGAFLMKAAIEFDPNEAVGLDGALARLADQPYGQALLGLTAVGLLAFAAYSAADARYHDPSQV